MATTTTTRTVQLEVTYGDYTTRNYKVPWQEGVAVEAVIRQIQAFNTAAATEGSSVKQTFLSESGTAISGITDATTIVKMEEVLYSAQN